MAIDDLLIATLDYIDATRYAFMQVDLSYSGNKTDASGDGNGDN